MKRCIIFQNPMKGAHSDLTCFLCFVRGAHYAKAHRHRSPEKNPALPRTRLMMSPIEQGLWEIGAGHRPNSLLEKPFLSPRLRLGLAPPRVCARQLRAQSAPTDEGRAKVEGTQGLCIVVWSGFCQYNGSQITCTYEGGS